jgi:predicted HTH transcriptional regulator
MQAEEIGLLLKQERGQFLEFISAYEYRRAAGQKKREEDLAREIVRVLSGMANADGGTVLVGVEPDKSVTGIPHDADELHAFVQAPQNLLRPQLHPSCEKVRLGNLQSVLFTALRAKPFRFPPTRFTRSRSRRKASSTSAGKHSMPRGSISTLI